MGSSRRAPWRAAGLTWEVCEEGSQARGMVPRKKLMVPKEEKRRAGRNKLV